MKYEISNIVRCPRAHVLKYLFEPEHRLKWQESLLSHKVISETLGEPGTVAQTMHQFGRIRADMIEITEANNLPDTVTVIYEAKSTKNRVDYTFSEMPDGSTRLTMKCEFRCYGFLWFLSSIAPGMIKKTTIREMKSFTEYAEKLVT